MDHSVPHRFNHRDWFVPVHSGMGAREPLDRSFNIAVLAMARRLLPCGFDVSDDAPDTYAKLRRHAEKTGRIMVWSGASDRTIFADPEVNYAFRAWHDLRHYTGRNDFSHYGEYCTYQAQYVDLQRMHGRETAKRWRAILHAEVMGMLQYKERWLDFPSDQRAFVEACLRDDVATAIKQRW